MFWASGHFSMGHFPLYAEIPDSPPVTHGRWLVIFYHDDCVTCQKAVPEYQAMAARYAGVANAPRVAFVKMPSYDGRIPGIVEPSAYYLSLALPADREWFAITPVCVVVQDGEVVSGLQGEEAAHPPGAVLFHH